jgi:uncharacterized lipoprotein YbaY
MSLVGFLEITTAGRPFSFNIVFDNDFLQKKCRRELEVQHKIMTFGADME